MIYVVSAKTLTETLPIISACEQFKTYENAKTYAERITNLWGNPVFIYSFGQEDCIEPKLPEKQFRFSFAKTELEYLTVTGIDILDATKKARAIYPKDSWELYETEEVEG